MQKKARGRKEKRKDATVGQIETTENIFSHINENIFSHIKCDTFTSKVFKHKYFKTALKNWCLVFITMVFTRGKSVI